MRHLMPSHDIFKVQEEPGDPGEKPHRMGKEDLCQLPWETLSFLLNIINNMTLNHMISFMDLPVICQLDFIRLIIQI